MQPSDAACLGNFHWWRKSQLLLLLGKICSFFEIINGNAVTDSCFRESNTLERNRKAWMNCAFWLFALTLAEACVRWAPEAFLPKARALLLVYPLWGEAALWEETRSKVKPSRSPPGFMFWMSVMHAIYTYLMLKMQVQDVSAKWKDLPGNCIPGRLL